MPESEMDTKLAVLRSEHEATKQELRDFRAEQKTNWEGIYKCLKESFVTKTEFAPISKFFYLIGTAVAIIIIGALFSLIIIKVPK